MPTSVNEIPKEWLQAVLASAFPNATFVSLERKRTVLPAISVVVNGTRDGQFIRYALARLAIARLWISLRSDVEQPLAEVKPSLNRAAQTTGNLTRFLLRNSTNVSRRMNLS